ncbi:MAG: ATP-binding protein, partial [Bacteroidota bacterium]
LFHLLQMTLGYGREDLFQKYWPDYVAMRATAKSMDPRHDAFLNFLLDNNEGLEQLRAYADRDPTGQHLDPSNAGMLYSNLGAGYAARGQLRLAESYVRKAIENEIKIDREGNLLRYYQQLADLGEAADESEWVADGLRGVQQLRDSMTRRDYQESISRLEVEYETQKTKTALAESELALSESRRQRNQLILGGLGLGLLLLVGFFYYQNRLKLQRLRADLDREQKDRELAEVRRQAELAQLRALIEGQETERTRVAKDLHDGLGGLLTTVKAHIAAGPENVEATELIDRACTSVRRIAHNMVPQTLAESGLEGSLGDLAAQLRVQGYTVDLEIIGQPDARLDLHQQSILLRIAQELTHNVVKHANAKNLLLQLIDRPDGLLLTVEDDGKGFNLDHAKRTGGLGLGSIEQRVAYLEGEIMYDSRPGEGTTVTVEVG